MSDFERELRRAKEDQKKQEEADRRSNQVRERQERLAYETSERERKEQARDEYRRFTRPLRPMVERLMQDLANQTWGSGNYAKSFECSAEEHNEGKTDVTLRVPYIAKWTVGLTETREKRTFGVLIIADKEVGNPWKTKRKRTLENRGDGRIYFYSVALQKTNDERLVHFNVMDSGLTEGASEQELRALLTKAFLRGPSDYWDTGPRSLDRGRDMG